MTDYFYKFVFARACCMRIVDFLTVLLYLRFCIFNLVCIKNNILHTVDIMSDTD